MRFMGMFVKPEAGTVLGYIWGDRLSVGYVDLLGHQRNAYAAFWRQWNGGRR